MAILAKTKAFGMHYKGADADSRAWLHANWRDEVGPGSDDYDKGILYIPQVFVSAFVFAAAEAGQTITPVTKFPGEPDA